MKYVVYRETVNGVEFVIKYDEEKGFHYITAGNYTVVVLKKQNLDKVFEKLKKDAA